MTRTFYVASRASVPARGQMWRALRATGVPIVSSWIDEDGPGQTPDMSVLWQRIAAEVASATDLVLYVERSDFPLKGAFVEVGMALALGKTVTIVCPDLDFGEKLKLVGSWILHPNVTGAGTVEEAVGGAR